MAEVRVAVLGGSGWMGKVHTMAYQTFPHFLGVSGGTARVVAIVGSQRHAAEDLAMRAPGAKILWDWRQAVNDPDVDLIDICLPDSLHYESRQGRSDRRQTRVLRKAVGEHGARGARTR